MMEPFEHFQPNDEVHLNSCLQTIKILWRKYSMQNVMQMQFARGMFICGFNFQLNIDSNSNI